MLVSNAIKRSAVAAAACLLLAAPALAYPVLDGAADSPMATAQEGADRIVDEMETLKETTNKTLRTIGEEGAGAVFSSGDWAPFRNGGLIFRGLEGHQPDACLGVEGRSGCGGDLSDVTAGKDTAEGIAYGEGVTHADLSAAARRREQALRRTTHDAYALALLTRKLVSQGKDHATKLQNIAAGATTLRRDVQANTATVIAVHQQIAQMQALLAAAIEAKAAASVRKDTAVSRAQAQGQGQGQGGTTPP